MKSDRYPDFARARPLCAPGRPRASMPAGSSVRRAMCGIVGFTDRSDAETAGAMVAALAHRGPDGSGVWTTAAGDRTLALGHTRLAIIDLSPDALQPFHRAPGPAG